MIDVKTLLEQYGYVVLFSSLFLELLALPVPGEVLLSYTGLLVFQGHLNWLVSMLIAGLGASAGITVSYLIGYRLGKPFFEKYGRRFHMGPDKLEKTSQWFQRYGNKMLIVGYFIPGVRHITGYFAGITRISFRTFALNAYLGAFLFTGIFITLGKVLGPKWEEFHHTITKYLILAGINAAFAVLLVYLYRKYRQQIFSITRQVISWALHTFHSLGRVRFFVVGVAVVFLALFALMVGMIQDLLANEFLEFDQVTAFVVHAIFENVESTWVTLGAHLASYNVLVPLLAITLLWIWKKGQDRRLEVFFMLLVLFGGELLDEGLRRLFHRSGPDGLVYTFPSEQTLLVLSVYGFAAYLFVRHRGRGMMRSVLGVLVLALSFYSGISIIALNLQFPSDVAAGYIFGGVWLTLNILLLEIFRNLRRA
ncbi:membrane protein DedA with SNARE-associated domain [Tumebacillus sp. BK434]|uniref:VTT domain-containing protein n=1 Tax=Tumebacillus sp. BK434 TaxID=2512169 RepID=UPI001051B077|nr:VTT domain-containing protein [Tumebacillus sp. BK434]TCP57880.1 membrane protein DedA with SNARE-associated domain [Tumebacillus sp. BK434]